jgi:phosphopantetheinyl transferase
LADGIQFSITGEYFTVALSTLGNEGCAVDIVRTQFTPICTV